jgi:hypothetical protein
MEHKQYPVGRFHYDESTLDLEACKMTIKNFPDHVQKIAALLQDGHMDIPYRSGGWTARQVIHHVADSHSHALLRIKCALSEHNPTIKPYAEDVYATLPDYDLPVDSALQILYGVHMRWSTLLEHLTASQWNRTYFHPGSQKVFTIKHATAMYDWHCRHHLGHLQLCLSIV